MEGNSGPRSPKLVSSELSRVLCGSSAFISCCHCDGRLENVPWLRGPTLLDTWHCWGNRSDWSEPAVAADSAMTYAAIVALISAGLAAPGGGLFVVVSGAAVRFREDVGILEDGTGLRGW